MYLEPWHADVFEFLELRNNHGKEEARARDLFYALWVPDLFMRRVREDGDWTLFCPNEAPGLAEVWGPEFEALYDRYVEEGRGRRTLKARELWTKVLKAQVETGTPFILYKDACNSKSNQRHLGTIKCSNLCTEIVEYTASDEVAVCNLASLALPRFVVDPDTEKPVGSLGAARRRFDFEALAAVVRVVVRNLNAVIDVNYYPVPEAQRSNLRHRPVGLGVQGLADVFLLMGLAYDSEGAAALNRQIFETLYYVALEESCALAEEFGPYKSYSGSPASQGLLQPDLWGVATDDSRHDWTGLRARIAAGGLRNSLLVAPMPTASTSQILGNTECFEPYNSNIYTRRVLSGEFVVVNKHLLADLCELGVWDSEMKNAIIAANGSVAEVPRVPPELRALYKTVWELKQRVLVDLAADRGPFIDQSQSLNVFLEAPTESKLNSLHHHAWSRGLKTGMYYLRTRAAVGAVKFTVEQPVAAGPACVKGTDCEACGS